MALKIEKRKRTVNTILVTVLILSTISNIVFEFSLISYFGYDLYQQILPNIQNSKVYMVFFKIINHFKLFQIIPDALILLFILYYPLHKLANWFFELRYMDTTQHSEKIRGSDQWDVKQLSNQIKKDYGRKDIKTFIKLNDKLVLPKDFENRSTLIVGSPGSGKSVLLRNIIKQVADRYNETLIVIDRKPEFIQNFYSEEFDLMFYPKATNSLKWDFGSELKTREDIRFFVEALIPISEDEKQPVFPLSAQLVLESILLYLLDHNLLSNKGLIDFLRTYKTPDTMKEVLFSTLEKYAINLDPYLQNDSNFSGSVMATLLAQFQKQFVIEDFYYENKEFSIKEYLNNPKGQRLFLVNRSAESNLYNAYYVLFVSFLSRNIKNLPNNTSRRIWLLADEFQSLRTANNRGLGALLSLLAEGRQKGSSVVLATQSLAQIKKLYKDTGLHTIFNTTNNKIFLQNQVPEEQKIITDLFGTVEEAQFNSSTSFASNNQTEDKSNISRSIKEKKVILPSELSNLKTTPIKGGMKFEAFIKMGHYPVSKFEYQTQDIPEYYKLTTETEIKRGFDPLPKKDDKTQNTNDSKEHESESKKDENLDPDNNKTLNQDILNL